jgi:MerR family redox-sensitive transcriptional activator SoxR
MISLKKGRPCLGGLLMLLSIGEVAERTGLATSAIRYYEKIGLLDEPPRSAGRRYYDPAILQRLSLILMARDAGLSLDEIQVLVNRFPEGTRPEERWRTVAPRKLKELEALSLKIEGMKAALTRTLRCDCATLDDCASRWEQGRGSLCCG